MMLLLCMSQLLYCFTAGAIPEEPVDLADIALSTGPDANVPHR